MESVKTLAQGYTFDQLNTKSWITEGTTKVPDSFKFNQILTKDEFPHCKIPTIKEPSCNHESIPNENYPEFFQANVQHPMVIQKCLPFRFNKNYKEYYKMIQYMTKKKINKNNNTTFHSLYGFKIADFKNFNEQLIVDKDTLDDSDIENLIDDEEGEDEQNDNYLYPDFDPKAVICEDKSDPDKLDDNAILQEYEDASCLTSTEISPGSMENVVNSYIVVGEKSFYLVGSHIIHKIFEYVDIVTFRPNLYPTMENKFTIWDDRILAITQDGYFVSIVMSRMDSNYIKDFTSHGPNKITQYWNLEMGKKWKIVTSTYHNFVAVVQQESNNELPFSNGLMVKLFYWVDAIEFRLVNSLILPSDDKVISCAFMPSKQPTLSICTGEDEGSKISLIQWNDNTFEVQETIIVKTTLCDPLSTLIPISETHLLVSNHLKPECIVSLDDLYENRFNPFTTTISSWREGIISWFYDDDMLASLISIDSQYQRFDHCIIIANKCGQVFCILSINNSEKIELYLIEDEITGLTSIGSCSNQDNSALHHFNILVTRYDECTELTIDFTKMKEMKRKEITSGYFEFNDIASSNNVVVAFSPICSLSPPKQTGLLSVDSRDEIWTTTDNVVCQIQPIPFIFTRRSFQINQVAPDFKDYCNINYITGNSMFGSKLIWVTDNYTITKCYAIEAEIIYNHLGGKSSQFQYVQLDDLLPSTNEETLFVHIYETFGIQVTKSGILLKSFSDSFEIKSVFEAPENHQISKAVFLDNKLVIWDHIHSKVWCINDLSLGINAQCQEITTFNKLLVNHTRISFDIFHTNVDSNDATVILRTETGLYSSPFEDFITNNNDNIALVKSIPMDDFVICNEQLCVFLYHNNVGCPLIRITNITVNNVVVWDRIATAFKPSDKVQLKKLNDRSIACYSLSRFFMIFLNEVNDIICEEVCLPYINRIIQLLDVEYDQSSQTLFCLFNDGLRMVNLTHLSQFRSHHFLPDLRNENKSLQRPKNIRKIFHYLKKLNRVLIAYPQMYLWYLLKLENGNILRLKNDLLENQKYTLQQVIEIEDKSSDTYLLLKFQDRIKYIKLSVKNHRIFIKEMDQYKSSLLYPKNNIVYNPQRDSFIIIQTDKICKDSDSDIWDDIYRYGNPNHPDYKSVLNPYHINNIRDIKSIYMEFNIVDNKINFTNKNVSIDIDFASLADYFVFNDHLIVNTVDKAKLFSCSDLNKGVHTKGKESSVNAVKISENMILLKEMVKQPEDGEYMTDDFCRYEIVFNGNFMEIALHPEKHWKYRSALQNETLLLLGSGEDLSPTNKEIGLNLPKRHISIQNESIWSTQDSLNTSSRFYAGEKFSGMWPSLDSNSLGKITDYIAGLPQIFPELDANQKLFYPRSLIMNCISKVHFDPQHNSLFILAENEIIYQLNNIPADFSTCNYMPLKVDKMVRKYMSNGEPEECSKSQPFIAKRQGFAWVSF
ncbi:hypothetical protein MOSE0_K00760 [Monosporozyma servazzii]